MLHIRNLSGLLLLSFFRLSAQDQADTLTTHELGEVTISGHRESAIVERLPDLQKTFIWSGKKSEVISVQNMDANITEKTPRQIFARIPGVFVYDMDGTGNQLNISTRGLDPHRGWEFNNRRNGTITNSDMYGYPASHYSIPMESVDRIQLVRGTGSLQYGAQFGGMLNYVSKQPDSTKAFSFESINSAGSFGLLSTYNAVSGSIGKFQYYAYYSIRKSDGYRNDSDTDYDAQSVLLIYKPNSRLTLNTELSRSNYVYKIPGPLTDSMFYADPQQSTRTRNYFNPEIWIPSMKADWVITPKTDLQFTVSAVLGARNSVQFDKPANIPDAINPVTLQYAPRQVDIDHFNSYTAELRISHRYTFLKSTSTVVAGAQVMDNDLHRQQLGKGTTGSDFDLALSEPGWGRDLHFKTKNIALFVENNFKITDKLSINPGFRTEIGHSDMYGTIVYYDPNNVPNTIRHEFTLFGVSAQYAFTSRMQLYGGWSQAYRPVLFKDIIPASTYESVDKDLKDASGYNAEVGFRGAYRTLRWDVTLYQVQYDNRMGSQASTNDAGEFVLYRTNIGDSQTRGIEALLQYNLPLTKNIGLSVFTSSAFTNAKYQSAIFRSGNNNIDVSGNYVESVPRVISRNGITLTAGFASISLLYSYTGKNYADPLNTPVPSVTGAVGTVPAYSLLDVNTSFAILPNLKVRMNINNITNKQYFTKRPAFYPGPGVWSSDGRSLNISIGLRI